MASKIPAFHEIGSRRPSISATRSIDHQATAGGGPCQLSQRIPLVLMALPDDPSSNDQQCKAGGRGAVSDPNGENTVVAGDDEDEDLARKKESEGIPPEARPSPSIPLSILADSSDLAPNSPSSIIVGTPFSDSNTRFEYPFPGTPQNSPTSRSLSVLPSASALVSSMSPPQLMRDAPPTSQYYPTSLSACSVRHPRMRAVDPPVPPALIKRQKGLSLGLGALSRNPSPRSGSAPRSPGDVRPSPGDEWQAEGQ
ncbi:hypothetical protein C8R47DRAFT_1108975 [Mycena vitilis]|nr:hypothetical protein C8R47DRAFT_1108975 [Mycena vitilis]